MVQVAVIAAAVICGLLALWCFYRAVWADRPRGRVRCPKCRYDLKVLVAADAKPGDVPPRCPECGKQAKRVRELVQWRVSRRLVVVGLTFAVGSLVASFFVTVTLDEVLLKTPTSWVIRALPYLPSDQLVGRTRITQRLLYANLNDDEQALLVETAAAVARSSNKKHRLAMMQFFGCYAVGEQMKAASPSPCFAVVPVDLFSRFAMKEAVRSRTDDETRGAVLLEIALYLKVGSPDHDEVLEEAARISGFAVRVFEIREQALAGLVEDESIRNAWLRTLDGSQPQDGIALIRVALKHPSPVLRKAGCEQAWRNVGLSRECLPLLQDAAVHDADSTVREQAKEAIRHIESASR